jgi:hypothetical protein
VKRILVVTALAATLGVAAVASPAGAGLPLTDLTVTPNSGRPGDAFTVSGGGCQFEQVDEEVAVGVAFPTPTETTTIPNQSGDWSVGFVVPPGTPPGVYEVAAECIPVSPPDQSSFGRARGGPVPIPYESGTYTVIGDPATPGTPPAAPVPGTPTFTG